MAKRDAGAVVVAPVNGDAKAEAYQVSKDPNCVAYAFINEAHRIGTFQPGPDAKALVECPNDLVVLMSKSHKLVKIERRRNASRSFVNTNSFATIG